MGRKWLAILATLGILAALLGVLLPLQMQIQQKLDREREIWALEQRMEQLTEEAVEKHRKLARWYNFQLEQGEKVPWDVYEDILNLGQGQMGILEVPQLGIRLPITHGIGGEAGHDPGSALPLGDGGAQSVLYLRDHRYWQVGMGVYTVLPGRKLSWQVSTIQVMPRGWPKSAPPGERMLTLVYDRGNTRTLIRCIPGPGTAAEGGDYGWILLLPVLIPALFGMGKMAAGRCKGRKNRKRYGEPRENRVLR